MKQKIKMFSSNYLKLLDMILSESRLPLVLPNEPLTDNDLKHLKKAVISNISKCMSNKISGYDRSLLKTKGELIHQLYYHGLKRTQIKNMNLQLISNEENVQTTSPMGQLSLISKGQ